MHPVFKKLKTPQKVLTPLGMKPFDGVSKSVKNVLKITTDATIIEAAEKHIFVIDNVERFACDLKINDKLQTVDGYTKILNIKHVGRKDVYDLINVEGELYYTDGILSHNSFIGSSYTLISTEKLQNLKPSKPLETVSGKLKIYEYFEKGSKYLAVVDPAKDGKDGFVVQFLKIDNLKFKQVAVSNLDIDYLLMPKYLSEWCQMYGNPYLIIENNEGAGQSVADQMKITYEYENLHYDTKTDSNSRNIIKSRKKYPGTRTTSRTRKQILQTLKTFFDNGNLEIVDADTISQLYTFILINDKYQADSGNFDDCVMSLALSFVIFNDIKNFSDMKAVTDVIHSVAVDTEVNISDIIVIGSFDQAIDSDIENPSTGITYSGFDDEPYYEDLNISEFG